MFQRVPMLALLGLSLSSGPAWAGGGYAAINLGYDVLPYGSQKGLDEITDWYNSSRPWLSTPMGHPGQGHGPAFDVQFAPKGVMFHHVGFRQRWSTVEARGISGGVDQTRQLSVGAGTLSYGIGIMAPVGDFEDLGLILGGGATLDVTFMRVTTRAGPPLSITDQDWVELLKKPVTGGALYLQLTRLAFETDKANMGLSIRPYYQVWFAKVKGYEAVNTAINPTYPYIDPETSAAAGTSGYGGFGINVSLTVFLGS